MKARVFSAYLKEVDEKLVTTSFSKWYLLVADKHCKRPEPTLWGSKLPFNTVCGEFISLSGGWVHGIAFSPSGDALAFASV